MELNATLQHGFWTDPIFTAIFPLSRVKFQTHETERCLELSIKAERWRKKASQANINSTHLHTFIYSTKNQAALVFYIPHSPSTSIMKPFPQILQLRRKTLVCDGGVGGAAEVAQINLKQTQLYVKEMHVWLCACIWLK